MEDFLKRTKGCTRILEHENKPLTRTGRNARQEFHAHETFKFTAISMAILVNESEMTEAGSRRCYEPSSMNPKTSKNSTKLCFYFRRDCKVGCIGWYIAEALKDGVFEITPTFGLDWVG